MKDFYDMYPTRFNNKTNGITHRRWLLHCNPELTKILDEEIEKLIQERQDARKAKNFARADEIRNQLLEQGIILEDTREGVKWKRA